MNPTFKKVLKNALKELLNRYANDGCNDLCSGDPLFEGLSQEEVVEVKAQLESEYNFLLVNLLLEKLESKNK